jgi:hypothetical protein
MLTSSSIPDFSLAKDGGQGWLSRVQATYRKVVGKYKDVEKNVCSTDYPNDDLESTF